MTPWADDFRQGREAQALGDQDPGLASGPPPQNEAEDINGLGETQGCAILDFGATVMCSSTTVAEEIYMQRLNQSEPGLPAISTSDRRFRFADGSIDEAQIVVEQPIAVGLLVGISLSTHLINKVGNDTCPILIINDSQRLRMAVDYEE